MTLFIAASIKHLYECTIYIYKMPYHTFNLLFYPFSRMKNVKLKKKLKLIWIVEFYSLNVHCLLYIKNDLKRSRFVILLISLFKILTKWVYTLRYSVLIVEPVGFSVVFNEANQFQLIISGYKFLFTFKYWNESFGQCTTL